MKEYYVNTSALINGDHQVHVEDCLLFPPPHNRILLGEFNDCEHAIEEARKNYQQVNGCIICTFKCYTP